MSLESMKERLRRAEVENAIRRHVPGSLPGGMTQDCVLRACAVLTEEGETEWQSREGLTAGDIVRDYLSQYGDGAAGPEGQPPRAAAYEEAKQAGDLAGMLKNAPLIK